MEPTKQDDRQGLPSASEFPRIVGCTGYLNFKKEVGEINVPESKFSMSGTEDHAIIALDGVGIENVKDKRRQWVIEMCIEVRNKIIRELFQESETENIREKRIWIRDDNGNRIFSGMCDHVELCKESGSALIIDYKTLDGEVEGSETNRQLMAQVACVSAMMERMKVTRNSIYVAIVQPTVTLTPIITRYDSKEIHKAYYNIQYRLGNAKDPLATKSPGEWCKYCPLAGRCAEAQGFAMTLFNGSIPEKIGQLTPEQVSSLVSKASVIDGIIESVKARAKELAAENKLPGYEISKPVEETEIVDAQGFFNAVRDYINKEELFSAISITKGPLELIFRDKYSAAIDCTKKQASEVFQSIVKKFGKTKIQSGRLVKKRTKK